MRENTPMRRKFSRPLSLTGTCVDDRSPFHLILNLKSDRTLFRFIITVNDFRLVAHMRDNQKTTPKTTIQTQSLPLPVWIHATVTPYHSPG